MSISGDLIYNIEFELRKSRFMVVLLLVFTDPYRVILITIIKYLMDSYSAPCPVLRALHVSLHLSLTAPYEKQILLCSFHKFKKLRPDEVKWSMQRTQPVTSDPAISPWRRSEPSKIQRDACSPMFTAVMFAAAKTWKQVKCPSTGEWIKNHVAHVYTQP